MAPMMGTELCQLEAIFAAVRPRQVFEWGPGGTTLYLLHKFGADAWVAVEHDPVYYARLLDLRDTLPLHLRHVAPSGPFNAYDREQYLRSETDPELFRDYVTSFGDEAPDLVLVDGRARNFCIWRAVECGAPLIVVHDAQRPEYRDTLLEFGAEFLRGWTGGQLAVITRR